MLLPEGRSNEPSGHDRTGRLGPHGVRRPMSDIDARKPAAPDPLVGALARLVEALEDRYPDGPAELTEPDLAMTADMTNMPIVSDPERSPAA